MSKRGVWVQLSAAAVARCDGETGVVLVEADAPCENPFEIIVLLDGVEALSYSPPLEFYDVAEMYDWRNIRDAKWSLTPTETQSVGTSEAWDGTQFVFVHGYNVNATEARALAARRFALMVPVLFVCGMILFEGSKSEDSTNAPPAMMQRVVSAPHISGWDEATRQLGSSLFLRKNSARINRGA